MSRIPRTGSTTPPAAATPNIYAQMAHAALDAGWSETDLADAFAAIALNVATTYFTHDAGTELDLPAAPPIP